jgi:hypothetical protein
VTAILASAYHHPTLGEARGRQSALARPSTNAKLPIGIRRWCGSSEPSLPVTKTPGLGGNQRVAHRGAVDLYRLRIDQKQIVVLGSSADLVRGVS